MDWCRGFGLATIIYDHKLNVKQGWWNIPPTIYRPVSVAGDFTKRQKRQVWTKNTSQGFRWIHSDKGWTSILLLIFLLKGFSWGSVLCPSATPPTPSSPDPPHVRSGCIIAVTWSVLTISVKGTPSMVGARSLPVWRQQDGLGSEKIQLIS